MVVTLFFTIFNDSETFLSIQSPLLAVENLNVSIPLYPTAQLHIPAPNESATPEYFSSAHSEYMIAIASLIGLKFTPNAESILPNTFS